VRAARPGRLVFAFTDGFHGGSFQAKSLTGLPAWQPIAGADADIRFLEFPRCSSCPQAAPFVHRRRLTFSGWQCDGSCFDPLEREIRDHCSVTAGIFLEPVLGVGGILPAARRFFDRLSQLCGQLRIPLVVDEVQTGFGRCGQSLFVSSRLGLVPDVICLAKGMANGIPMGLVVAVPEIAAAMKEKLHFSTFGGNPLSCAAALATLEVIRSRKLAENAHDVGEYLMDRLAAEIGEDERVVAIRGLGLLIGLEVTSNETAVGVLNECGRRGLLIGIGGRSRTVLRVEPPLTFTREMADDTVQTIASALRER
jgi:4-aminobutyrate aminotransferase-like enzyme